MFFITNGALEIFNNSNQRVVIRTGEFCGEQSLITGLQRPESICAVHQSELTVLSRKVCMDIINNFLELGAALTVFSKIRFGKILEFAKPWEKVKKMFQVTIGLKTIKCQVKFTDMFPLIDENLMKIDIFQEIQSELQKQQHLKQDINMRDQQFYLPIKQYKRLKKIQTTKMFESMGVQDKTDQLLALKRSFKNRIKQTIA